MPGLFRRLRARLRNRRFDEDLREELRLHEEMKREELEANGIAQTDARARARRALGNITLMREDSRRVWIASWLDSTIQDVRYAVRALHRQPLHAMTAISVLALAIGLNTSLFAAFKAIALEPWPVRDPGSVVRIWALAKGRQVAPSVDEFRFMRQHATSLSGLAAHTPPGQRARLQSPGQVDAALPAAWASANFFDLLRIRFQLGSGFIDVDDEPGNRRAPLVLSDSAWRNYFASDPAVIGRPVSVMEQPFTIVGVLEGRFDGIGRPVDLWMPLSAFQSDADGTGMGWEAPSSANCCVQMVGRLARGRNQRRSLQEVQLLHGRFSTAARRESGRVEVFGTSDISRGGLQRYGLFAAFGAAVALVLVLACANVGNLQLARGLARRREIATRLALGASRRRIVRQLLTEGLVLTSAAGALAIGVAVVLPPLIFRYIGEEIPPYMRARFRPDDQILVFTIVTCVVSCLIFALAPALHATRVRIPLGVLGRTATAPSRFQLRSILLATQIAVCTVLLAGAGLVTRAIAHAMSVDPGFTIEGVDVVSTALPTGASSKDRQALIRGTLAALERDSDHPVAVAPFGPIDDARYMMSMALPGAGPRDFETVLRRGVSVRYFDVLGIPLVKGRMFPSGISNEVVVNQALVRAYWAGEDPVGRTLHDVDPRKGTVQRVFTIVGVVRDTYLTGLERIDPVIFTPEDVGAFLTRGGPAAVERIRATAMAINPAAIITVRPLRENVRTYLEESRTGATLAWAIGLLGLVLATVGVFGVFAYAVEERRREIGVRLALGAARQQIIRMLVSSSGRAMILGLGAGLILSLGCGPLLRAYLFGLSPLDPIAYAVVTLLLAIAAGLATVVPARRACRVDPAVTLRED
jgi:predicted permease